MDLYSVLGVGRKASAVEIKRAYFNKARSTHPDKCPGDMGANERFQAVGRAFATLSDPERKQLYDTTGIVEEGGGLNSDGVAWADFWRDFYTRVTTTKVEEMREEYVGSAEEKRHLAEQYVAAKGDMDKLMDTMLFSTTEEEPRYRKLLEEMVRQGEVPKFRAFESEPAAKRKKRQQRAAREAEEAEELARELGLGGGAGGALVGGGSSGDGMASLRAALVARQARRGEGMLDALAAKYAKPNDKVKAAAKERKEGKAKGKAKAGASLDDPLDDAAFEKMQEQMLARAAARR